MANVTTTAGPVPDSQLGTTLMHEHLFVNLMREYRFTGLLNQAEVMADEVRLFVEAGGATIVDVTPAELTAGASPDPDGIMSGTPLSGHDQDSRKAANVRAIVDLAQATSVNVVVGTGHYRDPYLGEWIDAHSSDAIAELLVRDIDEGFPGTEVKAGIIGEVGADKWYISAREERVIRAAARAQVRTGLAITTHAARWPVGIPQLDLLAAEGVDPARVVIGHCDSVPIPEYHLEIARRGAFVQLDLLRGTTAAQTITGVRMVMALVHAGYLEHILLSHDNAGVGELTYGGGNGYAFIPTTFAQHLRDEGLSQDEVDQILIKNPRRALVAG